MRETHDYSASQYVRDNGFPLTWIVRLFTKRATSRIHEEAEENHHRHHSGRAGKIIGRVAGPEAYTGKSAMRFTESPRDRSVEGRQKTTE